MVVLPLANFDPVLVTVSLTFLQSKGDVPFYVTDFDYSRTDWNGLYNHLRDFTWEDVFTLGTSTAVADFFERVLVVADVHIPRL